MAPVSVCFCSPPFIPLNKAGNIREKALASKQEESTDFPPGTAALNASNRTEDSSEAYIIFLTTIPVFYWQISLILYTGFDYSKQE